MECEINENENQLRGILLVWTSQIQGKDSVLLNYIMANNCTFVHT